jgi:uncharacterized membrane protein YdcZ (DUF606 family)
VTFCGGVATRRSNAVVVVAIGHVVSGGLLVVLALLLGESMPSLSFQRTGVATGGATLILGQLAVSVIVDTKGIGDVAPIPLTWQRLFGLLVMGPAVYLLLPRK